MIPETGSVSLICPIRGEPEPIYFWAKDGDPFETLENGEVSSDGTLTISPITRSDAGLYHCSGGNDLGSVSMDPFNVTVACKCVLNQDQGPIIYH